MFLMFAVSGGPHITFSGLSYFYTLPDIDKDDTRGRSTNMQQMCHIIQSIK